MTQHTEDIVNKWLEWGSKYLVVIVVGIGAFYLTQLNSTLAAINVSLAQLAAHQVDSDKQIQSVIVARETNAPRFQKLLSDFETAQLDINTLKTKVETLERVCRK